MNLTVSSWETVFRTKNPTRPQTSPAESTPHASDTRLIRMATEAGNVIPPTALTTAPQIGLCGEVSASIPIHCVNRCADSPGKT